MQEVTYCEFLGFSEPREVRTNLDNAMILYNSKIEALERYPLMKVMSFVGIKDNKNEWIIKND